MDSAEPAGLVESAAECRRLQGALRIAEQDRQHLLFEIHDGVIQDLTAAALLLEGAGRQANFAGPDAAENFSGGLRLLRDSISKARQLLRGGAVTSLENEDLVAALSRVVAKARADLQLPVSLVASCATLEVPPSVQHLLLRIVQESLANVWKHAQASEIEVRLIDRDDCLELVVADNGIGFDPALVPPGHFGLESIRARAAALGAELVFDTAPNHGCQIVVRLRR